MITVLSKLNKGIWRVIAYDVKTTVVYSLVYGDQVEGNSYAILEVSPVTDREDEPGRLYLANEDALSFWNQLAEKIMSKQEKETMLAASVQVMMLANKTIGENKDDN